ncbi:hypothetical protein PoMZ_11645 [Pyricularia oryzae]|uniref:Uncharacterized protein n=1 Tax=Pyricularia oryzae TaxID=318829 RepID=A0A4V1C7B0_PYROR|nr:hypothetical protein PoMZ_11645 [Pyricularia oryzae]
MSSSGPSILSRRSLTESSCASRLSRAIFTSSTTWPFCTAVMLSPTMALKRNSDVATSSGSAAVTLVVAGPSPRISRLRGTTPFRSTCAAESLGTSSPSRSCTSP